MDRGDQSGFILAQARREQRDLRDNLVSLNEMFGELLIGIRDGVTPDPEWLTLAYTNLRDATWRLGYEWHGSRPSAEWLEKEEERRSEPTA